MDYKINAVVGISNLENKNKSALHELMAKWKSLSCVQLFATPWTIQSMEFSRPENWSG